MHMTLIVVGNDPLEEMMEPFYQDLEVEEYCDGEVDEWEKNEMLQWYEKEKGKKYASFEECYKENGESWNDNRWRQDENGVWQAYSTSNPNMEWDWYEVGGRWPGRLRLKEGAEPVLGLNFSWGWRDDKEAMEKFIAEHPNCCDAAYKGDVANIDELKSYAVLKDGEWIYTEDCDNISEYLKDVPDDVILTCVDYHM